MLDLDYITGCCLVSGVNRDISLEKQQQIWVRGEGKLKNKNKFGEVVSDVSFSRLEWMGMSVLFT